MRKVLCMFLIDRLMFRFRTMGLKLAMVLALSLSSAICFSIERLQEPVPKTVQEKVAKMYDAASECMKHCSPIYPPALHQDPKLRTFFVLPDASPKKIHVAGPDLSIMVRASSLSLVGVVNGYLCRHYTPPMGWQKKATLTREAAFERAKDYLKIFKIEVPSDYRPAEASFHDSGEGDCYWWIVWSRCCGQYLWDISTLDSETVVVQFYEKEGLARLYNESCNCPAPKRLDVKISKEEAIEKATQCIPLLQRTPIYLSCRRDGFIAKSVISCELLVSAPNWWFDPKRATYLQSGVVPKETRLCWKVMFETMDSKQEERRRKGELGPTESLAAPKMTIYIDAATGEAVGANST